MAYALNFDKRLKQSLKHLDAYEWVPGWHLDPRSKVDVTGLQRGVPRVLIEIELKKDNPVENVVKVWRWAKAEKIKSNILEPFSLVNKWRSTELSALSTKLYQYTRRPATANRSCSSL